MRYDEGTSSPSELTRVLTDPLVLHRERRRKTLHADPECSEVRSGSTTELVTMKKIVERTTCQECAMSVKQAALTWEATKSWGNAAAVLEARSLDVPPALDLVVEALEEYPRWLVETSWGTGAVVLCPSRVARWASAYAERAGERHRKTYHAHPGETPETCQIAAALWEEGVRDPTSPMKDLKNALHAGRTLRLVHPELAEIAVGLWCDTLRGGGTLSIEEAVEAASLITGHEG